MNIQEIGQWNIDLQVSGAHQINLLTLEIFQEATWLSFPLQPGPEGGMERAGNTKLIFRRCLSLSSASI